MFKKILIFLNKINLKKSLFESILTVFLRNILNILVLKIMNENSNILTPYENFLLEHEQHVHQVIDDMQKCKLELIRRTPVEEMEKILKLFKGSSLNKKKEELMEFLRLMPEYRSTDQDVLYRRLKALKERIKVTQGTSDLYFYALRTYRSISASESDA